MKSQRFFFYPLLAYLILLGVVLLAYPKGTLELWVNKNMHFDTFFFWITYLGDGLLYVFFSLALGVKNKRWAVFALICYAVTGLFTQFLKVMIFSDMPRPSAFFGENVPLRYVEGVEIHSSNSFPSGHATSAFSLAMLISLYSRQGWVGFLCICLAILAGFSRVYLMQHFFIDTYFGALIGVLGTLYLYRIAYIKKLLS